MTTLPGLKRRLISIKVLLGAVLHGKFSVATALRLYCLADFRLPDDMRSEAGSLEAELNDLPMAPKNVRALIDHDREIPLELVYNGQDSEGCHVWVAPYMTKLDEFPRCIDLLFDGDLPENCKIELAFYGMGREP
jgi:hypothetical protein